MTMQVFQGVGLKAGAAGRLVTGCALALGLLSVGAPAVHAASPNSGTLTDSGAKVEYDSGPFFVSNPSGTASLDGEPMCISPIAPCDEFALTVQLPANYATLRPYDQIRITTSWTVAGTASPEDIDIYLLDSAGAVVKDSASSSNPEVIIAPAESGTRTYKVRIVPFAVAGATPHTTIELVQNEAPPAPAQAPTSSVAPRFRVFESPAGIAGSAGEPSIGYNRTSKRAMFTAGFDTARVTFPEDRTPPLPESAGALWEKKNYPYNTVSLDPIGYTDPWKGRSFTSQLTGANSMYGFTDDDGQTWTPGQFGPPNGGADHQTTGSGPYPAGQPFDALRALSQAAGFGNAVYYCSQSIAASFCARSDDGGLTFGPGMPTWTLLECGGLHGHVRVAYDGTVALPNKGCGGGQGVAFSFDAGNTWTVSVVPGTSGGDTDPQLAWSDTEDPQTHQPVGYFCFIDGDGKPKAAVTKDRGQTWSTPVDLGAAHGIKNAVFAQGIAGDHDRAACAFIGTTTAGNYGALSFKGIWYPFVAMTHDGGASWQTVNASPTDPVQGEGGICTSGTTCGSNRNLLDFNEMALDEDGRPLFGYADGCIGACVQNPANNSFSAKGAIIRQSGGLTLFRAKDGQGQFSASAVVPAQPYLSVTKNASNNTLNWTAPDDGGAAISGYKIYRDGVLLATLNQPKLDYTDTAINPATDYAYAVAAVNSVGEGARSDAAAPTQGGPTESVCGLPGLTKLTDAAGDQANLGLVPDPQPQHDLLKLSVAQPYAQDGVVRLMFQLKVSSLSQLTPRSGYYTSFKSPDNVYRGVRMVVDASGTPAFQSYVVGANNSGGQDGRFVSGTPKAAEAGSGYTADGLITIVVKPADIGLNAAGEMLTGFNAGVIFDGTTPVGGITDVVDEMPDGLGREGEFTLLNNASGGCAPNTPPVATLTASPQSGTAPLNVTFTASASDDDGDAIVEYRLDYGDGSAPVTQASGAFSHSYSAAGNYPARLTVKDARGAESNVAEKIIQVSSGGSMAVSLAATSYSKSPNPDGTYTVSQASPLNVTFTATAQGSDGAPYWYTFNFGDGQSVGPQRSNSATHAYPYANQDGYRVKVTMTDDAATRAAVSNEVVVKTTANVVINGGTVIDLVVTPTSGDAPLTVTANANGPNARHDAATAVTEYTFDFGDGSAVINNTSGSASHVYTVPEARTYTVSVTMTDKNAGGTVLGTSTASATVSVNSGNRLTALLAVSPTTANVGDTITFDGCHSFAADGHSITRYVFDPDGAGSLPAAYDGANCTASYAYASAGSFTPTLTVYDDTGAFAKVEVQGVRIQTPPSPGTGGGTNTGGVSRRGGGGAFGWLSLLPLGVAIARRRGVKPVD
ncbi:PKD domain-containing protein [Fontimonas sp. SYSU GA230001]|uniref:PKD domain-containing protein n=1 Tax=Fontimonas sp. SYSU GA230001 TaxID=3142450 RepID=UPI0032B39006